jgi:hypothetical protein
MIDPTKVARTTRTVITKLDQKIKGTEPMDGFVFSSWKINQKDTMESRKTAEARKCQGLSFIEWVSGYFG